MKISTAKLLIRAVELTR